MAFEKLFQTIEELVMCHSPSGDEGEIDRFLLDRFSGLGVEAWIDEADNVIAKIPGNDPDRSIAITGHKDEIGAIVNHVEVDGRVKIRKLGGSFPWVYGEGVVDLLGDRETISGILSFGSRHVSHESPQKLFQEKAPLTWEDAWVETQRSIEDLDAVGVRPGTRVVVGKHRKHPFRLNNTIASYTLDNKASVAILLALAESLEHPPVTVYLVASAKEEVGAIGALYFTNRIRLEALVALEICPLAREYPIRDGDVPVLLSQDGYGIYDEGLTAQLRAAAQQASIPVQHAIVRGFGSDGSIAMKLGHVARAACLGFPTQNTHGFEIAHLGAIDRCIHLLASYCQSL
ncbi:MAG: M20/M25/M40 family metallo-hydrolase [Cyanobacteria bacterium SID2]|nr:M20/M25/M40 family metallo-hydrolase [Cyanobacteria bacterium SID2]MBP0005006.1 M20/M25/M40 family metallo-hydrolase [Cyanobacteria bacterium SBC]